MAILTEKEIASILKNEYHDPFEILGMHKEAHGMSIRVFQPQASVIKVLSREKQPTQSGTAGSATLLGTMTKVHADGIFELALPEIREVVKYQLDITNSKGEHRVTADPYSFLPLMDEQSRYFFNEGTHQCVYDEMGSHVRSIDGVKGVGFLVWAPNAKQVAVVGGFNSWDGRCHPMRMLGSSGIWDLFIPGLDNGDIYKYEIKKKGNDHLILKTDPYGYYQESPPNHATVVCDINTHSWKDASWMEKRALSAGNLLNRPMSMYEVHLGSWRKKEGVQDADYFTYKEIAVELAAYVKEMGYTHIELMPVQDHPFVPSWGYQVCGFYAPNHRFGSPADFQYFVDYMHQQDIGIIMDWVPGHFPKDAYGLAHFDGSHLYEHSDPREGEHKDWGTLIFNFGRNEVKNFLVSNALFWLDKFHIDGLRVDAVASMLYRNYSRKDGEWIPNKHGGHENLEAVDLMRTMNKLVHEKFPGAVTIAEESTSWPMVSRPTYVGGLGFTFKWNMGWMNDNLVYFSKESIHKKYHHNQLTFGMWYAYSENFVLVVSHDEVVHGKKSLLEKMPGDTWQKFANLRAFFAHMFAHPGKKLMFMGDEFGMRWEWDCMQQIQWQLLDKEKTGDAAYHIGLKNLIKDLNHLYVKEPAYWARDFEQVGFEWIDCRDSDNSTVSFIRKSDDPDDFIVSVSNFTPVVRNNYRLGVPREGFYREIINTDAAEYGGSGKGNMGGVQSEHKEWHAKPHSINLIIPPLGSLVLKWYKERPAF